MITFPQANPPGAFFGAGNRVSRIVLIFFIIMSGCVSLPRSFHATDYRNNKVYLNRHHYYEVGPLSGDWQRFRKEKPGILFQNVRNRATIATEVMCGAAFEDLPLTMLTGHFFDGLTDIQRVKMETWRLSRRDALYTEANARLDGAEVKLNIVVIKKDNCHFDFLAISVPQFTDEVTRDFQRFVKGFHYQP